MAFFSTAGSKVSIGTALPIKSADFVAADFTAIVYQAIGGLEAIGSVGDASEAITQELISEARIKTMKGTRNAGTMELVMAIDYADAGQLALIAAEKTTYDYAFKIEFNDKPSSGAAPKNSTRQFIGKVMSAVEALDTANNVMKMTVSIAVNSNIVRTDASAS